MERGFRRWRVPARRRRVRGKFFDFTVGELFREREVRLVIFGDDEAALVSLSSRWTMPGRATPPMPLNEPSQ